MSLLLPFLDGESYTMRNAVVSVIGRLIAKAPAACAHTSAALAAERALGFHARGLCSATAGIEPPSRRAALQVGESSAESANAANTRDAFIRLLMDRALDVNAFTRSKARCAAARDGKACCVTRACGR